MRINKNGIMRIISLVMTLIIIISELSVSTIKTEAASIEYNYAKLLQESLYFYDANMCGTEVSDKSAFSWRGNCHAGDKKVKINGKTVDVSGGFHDAGDHLKAGLPQAYTATMLGIEYMEFTDAFNETGSTAHLKKITTHFAEYFERCTVLKKDGSVDFFVYQVSDGDEDHKKWEAPEKQNSVRKVYYTSKKNPATDEVSEAAAALAVQYINFNDKTALDFSKKLFAYAKSFKTKKVTKEGLYDSSTGGYLYDSQSWGDDYALAAALLYKATKDSTYKSEFDKIKSSNQGGYNIYSWLSWDNVSALADYYGAGNKDSLKTCADNMKRSDKGYSCLLEWGSARYNCNTQFLGLLYDKASKKKTYKSWATGQMKYLMGNNKQKKCYIVGYNKRSVKYPHHRAASNSTDAGIESKDHYILLGALVGGPKDSSGTYTDSQSDYQCNEVALDYNAGLVGAAAGLYLIHKKDTNAAISLMTKSDLKKIKLRFNYGLGLTKPSILTAKNNKKKSVTLSWSKKDGANGYQVQYSTSKKFKSKKTVEITGSDITTTRLKKLKKKKNYYIRVRAYKTVDGRKQYSAWSAKKKVKIKK
ncbi:MAG: glycoside hydrolase family 9 protein [Eubacterium sp.]|nr:glycoside hydrolase family 9 protein [Eubacterium sp.]